MNDEIYAKSGLNAPTLENHSFSVQKVSLKIIEKIGLEYYCDQDIIETIKIASLLHDIGKSTKKFQKFLENNKNKRDYSHSQVGWAFIEKYLNIKDKEKLEYISNVVYWHHGKYYDNNKNISVKNIIKSIDENDINTMKEFVKNILGSDYILDKCRKNEVDFNQEPSFYFLGKDCEKYNQYNTIIRTCVISADRIASNLEEKEKHIDDYNISKEINKITQKENDENDLIPYEGLDIERFNKQKDIIKKTGKTSIIKATSGFGKSMLGFIWNFWNHKKLIWVCPRNFVSRSVYESITNEIKNFGLNISVELYLSGEVDKSINNENPNFNSDIIITNIDNYLAPCVKNDNMDKLFLINYADVVFDEFHELIGESAIFSSFINLMNIRNNFTNAETLLLSATPSKINYLWETIDQKTTILPSENKHYETIHNKKYKVNFHYAENFNHINNLVENKKNHLIIINSIKNSQNLFINLNREGLLYHSKFEENKRNEKFNYLIEEYGKHSNRTKNKTNLIGTHIIQASVDVSFNHLTEVVMSPESTLQRIGRCDRWGDYETQSMINLVKFNNNSERSTIRTLYNETLSEKWYDFLRENIENGEEITLKYFYNLYNEFYVDHKNLIDKDHIQKLYDLSLQNLNNIYPIKINQKSKNNVITAGSNKLRISYSNQECFVIYKKSENTNSQLTFTEPFSEKVYKSFEEDFEEDENIKSRILKSMKRIEDEGDDRYDYQFFTNKNKNSKAVIYLNEIRRSSKKSNTPYIAYNKEYDEELGVVDTSLLQT